MHFAKNCLIWQGNSYDKEKVSGENKHSCKLGKAEETSVIAAEVEGGIANPPVDFVLEGHLAESKDVPLQKIKMWQDTGFG